METPILRGRVLKKSSSRLRSAETISGRNQSLRPGSYVIVPDSSRLRLKGSLTLQVWIAPTTPSKGVQGILTKWSGREGTGYGLVIDENGSLALWLGDANGRIEKFSTGVPLRASPAARVYQQSPDDHPNHQMVTLRYWTFVAATFDAPGGRVALYQQPGKVWPGDGNGPVEVEISTSLRSIGLTTAPLLMAALLEERNGETETASYFNGKIENLRIFDRALTKEEIVLLRGGRTPRQPLAQWDFAADVQLRRVRDLSPNNFHGRTVNMPMKGATGHSWNGEETNFKLAPEAYGAIYFHDDDLNDAGWEVDFQFHVPPDLKSGVYAARLRTADGEDYIPFFVRPPQGTATAPIAFLAPTFSYLAYGTGPGLLSLYSFHSDGSGVCYASRLRPLTNMRPKKVATWQGVELVHQLNADLHMIDWLEEKGHPYDVLTDEDLHLEGSKLLSPYKVVMTGSHPEYWSEQMLDGLETYLGNGGRRMYLGGNGFYWVTSLDPEEQHTIEIRRHHGTELWQAAPGEYYLSTTGELGGLWRFRGRPPQKLVGVGFSGVSALYPSPGRPYLRQPDSQNPRAAFIFEGVATDEVIGHCPSLLVYGDYGAAGFELDRADPALGTPPHALVVASATGFSDVHQHAVEEVLTADSMQKGSLNRWLRGDMVYFEYPNGDAVFSVGAIAWHGSLSYNGYDNNVSRITDNVLKKFASESWTPGS